MQELWDFEHSRAKEVAFLEGSKAQVFRLNILEMLIWSLSGGSINFHKMRVCFLVNQRGGCLVFDFCDGFLI